MAECNDGVSLLPLFSLALFRGFYFMPTRWHHGWMKGFLIFSVLLFLLFCTPASADYAKGLDAAMRGDYATALREWKQLADEGDASGQNGLGFLYSTGKGVQQDLKVALELFTLSANQGFAKAQSNLGNMYHNGRGVMQDYKTAVIWYTLAAEQRYAPAQNALGDMSSNGQGVSQNYKAAIKWYKLAAKQRSVGDQQNPTLWPLNRDGLTRSNAVAQYNLGSMYENGEGVIQDYEAALEWYTLAAERENAEAQNNLGVMYALGHGVIQDYTRAHMWWTIAASQGDEKAAENRDEIANDMTSADISKAQNLARECVAKNYKDC
jgi:hypothetical protein